MVVTDGMVTFSLVNVYNQGILEVWVYRVLLPDVIKQLDQVVSQVWAFNLNSYGGRPSAPPAFLDFRWFIACCTSMSSSFVSQSGISLSTDWSKGA